MKNLHLSNSRFKIFTLISLVSFLMINVDGFSEDVNFSFANTKYSKNVKFHYIQKHYKLDEYQDFVRYTFPQKIGEFLIETKEETQQDYTFIIGKVKILSGKSLTIKKGHTLVIYGKLTALPGSTLINEGNLVIRGSLFIGDQVTAGQESYIVNFQNKPNANLYITQGLVGQHVHGSTIAGNIAVIQNVMYHFHLNENTINPKGGVFYYRNNDFSAKANEGTEVIMKLDSKNRASKKYSRGEKKIDKEDKEKDRNHNKITNLPYKEYFKKICNKNPIKKESLLKLQPYLTKQFKDLPVELSSFSCTQEESFTAIKWATAQEINNSHFTIEKSYDKKNFEKIDEVEGQGNSNTVKQYKINVPIDNKNRTVYYRLTQFDFDGKSESWIQAVMSNEDTKVDVSVYPNPTTDFLKVETNSTDDTPMDYYLINTSTGAKTKLTSSSSQYTSQKFDVSGLSQGIYILEIIQGNKRIYQNKVIKK
ncbi:T9SS type A sorting domain-containing protein [Flammeovirga kamogawensis]|uniref:T9SS type A sorting domain-containing protein n=1 Tax=Flammeovirga kamogawensis TaxID=373891 RepID=A0ABX8GYP0_9BACT|nr:T9SS type A sorting domain-containing protein [Flammeovirga kamogawensis]MBB6459159.1 hypothetical protein [Flammeovirga kamogawensis]QWG08725.1 T9SS type A sorting domain-containing protein [Flammeovirga kamogawensis]TRX67018.1 T9SS type A sorting domain-containing protein [Flammeovirga kamogawensis]